MCVHIINKIILKMNELFKEIVQAVKPHLGKIVLGVFGVIAAFGTAKIMGFVGLGDEEQPAANSGKKESERAEEGGDDDNDDDRNDDNNDDDDNDNDKRIEQPAEVVEVVAPKSRTRRR